MAIILNLVQSILHQYPGDFNTKASLSSEKGGGNFHLSFETVFKMSRTDKAID